MPKIIKDKYKILILTILIPTLTSCYTQKDKRFLQDAGGIPQYEYAEYEDYKIRVNDELLFRVITTDIDFVKLIGVGNTTRGNIVTYRVYQDGTIDIPFVESVHVAGKTIPEAAKEIERRLKQIIPDVKINLTLSNKVYTVIGDAGKGIFPVYKERMTIFQALAQSGKIGLSGDRKHIKIIREKDGQPEILEFDIRSKSLIESKYYYVYPNDIIYIQREPASFYKTDSFGSFISLVTSSISLFTTIYYWTKYNK